MTRKQFKEVVRTFAEENGCTLSDDPTENFAMHLYQQVRANRSLRAVMTTVVPVGALLNAVECVQNRIDALAIMNVRPEHLSEWKATLATLTALTELASGKTVKELRDEYEQPTDEHAGQ